MKHGIAANGRTISSRPWTGSLLAGGLVGLALVVAACGGGSAPPGVANLGSRSTTTTVAPAAQAGSTASNYPDAVAYAQCMRAHGVTNYPDPTSTGQFIHEDGKLNGQSVDLSSPQTTAADKACSHLLPNGGDLTPAEQQQALAEGLKHAACMRTHGVPNFPDPTATDGGVGVDPKGLDMNSPQFKAAWKKCLSIAPPPGGAS